MRKVSIWCDGACSGNPGPGAFAVLLKYGEFIKEDAVPHKETTTNQRMELSAAIHALSLLKEPCEVVLTTDSKYVVDGMTDPNWLFKWKSNGWKNSKGKPIENQDLWQKLDRVAGIHEVVWVHTAGHANNMYNNRVDDLARTLCQSLKGGEPSAN